jgi:hypothetical protein
MIVMSTSSMKVPSETATNVHHRFGSGTPDANSAVEDSAAGESAAGESAAEVVEGAASVPPGELTAHVCPDFGKGCKK